MTVRTATVNLRFDIVEKSNVNCLICGARYCNPCVKLIEGLSMSTANAMLSGKTFGECEFFQGERFGLWVWYS